MTELETTHELETTLPPGGDIPPADTSVTPGDSDTPTSKPNIPDNVPYDRFQEVNEEKKELRIQNERLLTILQNQGASAQSVQAPPVQEELPDMLPMPTREAFTKEVDGYPEYDEAAHLAAIGKTATDNAMRMVKHEQNTETARTETQRRAEQGQALHSVIIEAHPDFPELMKQGSPSGVIVDAIYALDREDRKTAAEVTYYLAKNPGELHRINGMDDRTATLTLGKLAAKMSSPAATPKTVSDAPPPAGPLKTTEIPTTFDPLKSTSAEYAAHHPIADQLPWLKK